MSVTLESATVFHFNLSILPLFSNGHGELIRDTRRSIKQK